MEGQSANVLYFVFKSGGVDRVPLNRAPMHDALTELNLNVSMKEIFQFPESAGLRPFFDVDFMRLRGPASWDLLIHQLRTKGVLLSFREAISAYAKCQTIEIQLPWIVLGSMVMKNGILMVPVIESRNVGVMFLNEAPPYNVVYPVRVKER